MQVPLLLKLHGLQTFLAERLGLDARTPDAAFFARWSDIANR